MGVAARDAHRERAASPRRTLHADLAAVQSDELLHQRQAYAGSFVCSGARVFNPVEALEDAALFGLRYAYAGVPYRQFITLSGGLQRDYDLAFKSELERVRQEIEDNLLPHLAIDV